mgnify:CR=1 FL=1
MSAIIYTAGYTSTKPAQWQAVAQKLDLTVIDTRISPMSRNPGAWDKTALEALLGIRYVHVRELGNRNYKGGDIAILDLDRGVKLVTPYLRSGKSIVLMCACTSHHTCHRTVVACELARLTGCKVTNWTANDLKAVAESVSAEAAADMPLQIEMFPGLG